MFVYCAQEKPKETLTLISGWPMAKTAANCLGLEEVDPSTHGDPLQR